MVAGLSLLVSNDSTSALPEFGFVQQCEPVIVDPALFFYVWPVGATLCLVLLGAFSVWLWIRAKSWKGRIVPGALLAVLIAMIVWEPVTMHRQMAAVQTIAQSEVWNGLASFEARDVSERVTAYALPREYARKCKTGFLVRSAAIGQSDAWGFTGGYPNSPTDYLRREMAETIYDPVRLCRNRLNVLAGEDSRSGQSCNREEPRILFFSSIQDDSPGFEMEWCQKIDDHLAYCETDSLPVDLASGIHY